MTMLGLAVNSLRFRLGRFTATFINLFLGAVILTAFASLFDTATGSGVSAADKSSLTTIASAVGGWGLLIVVFGVASTMNLTIRQRQGELALLKAAGATPAQIGRMIIGEGVAIALIASLIAIAPAVLIGRAILSALQSTDQTAPTVEYSFGSFALIAGPTVTLVATIGAAAITAWRTGRIGAKDALTQLASDGSKISRSRILAGAVFITAGISCAIMTATVLKDEGFLALSIAGQAGIACAIGLALLSPFFLRAIVILIDLPTRFLTGAPGYLAASNIRRRTDQTAAITMPVIIFTALAAVSLYTLKIQNKANAVDGITVSADDEGVQTLTFIIVGMIAVFAAIVVINNCVATMLGRRSEFALARKIGATPSQLIRSTMLESTFAVVIGVALGTAAAAAGVAGYNYGRTGSFTIQPGPVTYVVIVATIVILTLAASLISTTRSLATPMLEVNRPRFAAASQRVAAIG